MGDGFSGSILDYAMYFLVFGGVPFLSIVLPLIVAPMIYRTVVRRFAGNPWQDDIRQTDASSADPPPLH